MNLDEEESNGNCNIVCVHMGSLITYTNAKFDFNIYVTLLSLICRYKVGLLLEMGQKLFCPKSKVLIVMRAEVCE